MASRGNLPTPPGPFDELVEREDTDPLNERDWGPAPTPERERADERAIARRASAERARVARVSVTVAQAAGRLGGEATVGELLRAGDLVCFDHRAACLLPRWQFDESADGGVVPGLRRLARFFPGGALSITQWVMRPSADLGGRTPRDALAAGDVDAVVDVAATLTAAGW